MRSDAGVPRPGLEPGARGLEGRRSIQLSYRGVRSSVRKPAGAMAGLARGASGAELAEPVLAGLAHVAPADEVAPEDADAQAETGADDDAAEDRHGLSVPPIVRSPGRGSAW